jgi:hypothetical protein
MPISAWADQLGRPARSPRFKQSCSNSCRSRPLTSAQIARAGWSGAMSVSRSRWVHRTWFRSKTLTRGFAGAASIATAQIGSGSGCSGISSQAGWPVTIPAYGSTEHFQ